MSVNTSTVDIYVRKPGDYHNADHWDDPKFEVKSFDIRQLLADAVGPGRITYLSKGGFNLPQVVSVGAADGTYPVRGTSLLIQTAHSCFATHQGIGLNPDTIWQTIVHQVAEHIKQDPRRYARLFTWFPDQQEEIEVRDDALLDDNNWLRTLGMFEERLRFLIGDELVTLFVPDFSTTTELERVAALVGLMDAASPYYEYVVTTKCHIPLIQLEGTAEDWRQLCERVETLRGYISGLGEYFQTLLPVLREIGRAAQGQEPDNDFWSSIYKFQSSSGRKSVTGWLTALMAFKYGPSGPVARTNFDWQRQIARPWEAFRTNEFSSLLCKVPFTWKLQGRPIAMNFVAGALGVNSTGTVYTPRLGIAVMER